ncbi:HNH endonuclease signature motif containing protein [Arthrobacter sp. 35W]|uniref:HNH endonuclease signature motif containing protein n=1 Tax=Arthrobacter sp. 35W TaxID=1132441 RepID=UPI00047ACA21|nr:HNH endonuclease signature motif containing protein [Arthrobacter sp. 35W]
MNWFDGGGGASRDYGEEPGAPAAFPGPAAGPDAGPEGRDAPGRDPEGRDAPGLDPEGRDAPGLDPEGRDAPGRGVPVAGGHLRAVLRLALAAADAAGPAVVDPAALHLPAHTDAQLTTRAAQLESLARHLAALQIHYAGEIAARAAAGRYTGTGATNPINLLAETLQISGREAARRIILAEHLLPTIDPLTTHTTAPRMPALAAAFFAGALSIEAARIVADYTTQASHLADGGRITLPEVRTVEEALTALAVAERPEILTQCAHRTINLLDPDGTEPTEAELLAKEGIHFTRPRRGLVHFDGHLTVVDYEELLAAIGTATNPRQTAGINTIPGAMPSSPAAEMPAWARGPDAGPDGAGPDAGPDGGTAGAGTAGAPGDGGLSASTGCAPTHHDAATSTAEAATSTDPGPGTDPDQCTQDQAIRDRRPRPQALLHALLDCVHLAARTDTLPDNGGLRPQLFITVTLAELRSGLGSALLPYAGSTSIASIRQAACDAHLIPAVLGTNGEVLDLGRSQRLVSAALRRALVVRDHGCAFPGCTRPPQWTEAHHIVPWACGGETSLANCVLLCSWHHHLLHHTGWTAALVDGVPWFTPPLALDRLQRPRRNHAHNPDPVRLAARPPMHPPGRETYPPGLGADPPW